MAYNLSTAAAATGANKSTILRAIEAGRISAQRDAANEWSIQVDELHRVFPALPGPATTEAERDATTDVLVAELRQTVADLRADRVRCAAPSLPASNTALVISSTNKGIPSVRSMTSCRMLAGMSSSLTPLPRTASHSSARSTMARETAPTATRRRARVLC
jgi:hypothetical protein